ncbi:MAG: hypothetical protein HC888_00440 [Candidatus Competibacteraceae bacterium]|nr:hypothetical protein [Candidatus Competibacteraceae bacterium]
MQQMCDAGLLASNRDEDGFGVWRQQTMSRLGEGQSGLLRGSLRRILTIMPIYEYKHPKTGEIFNDIRTFSKMTEPFVAPDGTICPFISWFEAPDAADVVKGNKWSKSTVDKKCEVWEKDPEYVRKCNPKYVRTRSGERIRYNPNSMS